MGSPEHKAKIWNMIKDIKVGMLTTQIGDDLHARPMHLVQDEYTGHLFLFTNLSSEKSFEVDNDRSVCITFSDIKNETYVSLSGHARLSTNRDLINKFWNPFVSAWFPEGKESPDVGLIDIHVRAGEHWDGTSSKLLQLFEITKANIADQRPDMGENEKFGHLPMN